MFPSNFNINFTLENTNYELRFNQTDSLKADRPVFKIGDKLYFINVLEELPADVEDLVRKILKEASVNSTADLQSKFQEIDPKAKVYSRVTDLASKTLSPELISPKDAEMRLKFIEKAKHFREKYNAIKEEQKTLKAEMGPKKTFDKEMEAKVKSYNEKVLLYNKEANKFSNDFEEYFLYSPNSVYKAETIYPDPLIGHIFSIGERTLYYTVSGKEHFKKGRPTFILETGLSSLGSFDWHLTQQEIAKFATVVSYDRAGTGRSSPRDSKKEESYLDSIENDFQQLLEQLKKNGIEPPYVVVGHSMGGIYAQYHALKNRDQIVGLVLVDSASEKEFIHEIESVSDSNILLEPKTYNVIQEDLDDQLWPSGRPYFLEGTTDLKKREADWLVAQQKNGEGFAEQLEQRIAVAKAFHREISVSPIPFGEMPLLAIARKIDPEDKHLEKELEYQAFRLEDSNRSTHSKFITSNIADHAIPYLEPQFLADQLQEFHKQF